MRDPIELIQRAHAEIMRQLEAWSGRYGQTFRRSRDLVCLAEHSGARDLNHGVELYETWVMVPAGTLPENVSLEKAEAHGWPVHRPSVVLAPKRPLAQFGVDAQQAARYDGSPDPEPPVLEAPAVLDALADLRN
jgi:hypothetical protein